MQNPCQDSYYTLFSSYTMLLDYHEEQAKNSRWIRCKVADLQVEPLGESSPLIGNLSAFAAGTSQEAVKDTIPVVTTRIPENVPRTVSHKSNWRMPSFGFYKSIFACSQSWMAAFRQSVMRRYTV